MVSSIVRNKIATAVPDNPRLTTNDLVVGRGLGFVPSAIDTASVNKDRLMIRSIRKTALEKGGNQRGMLFTACMHSLNSEIDSITVNYVYRKNVYSPVSILSTQELLL